ncbi:MAG TPA: glycoside hydrolase domain-containing protein [Actinospica sp.]|nr:glycoside hydrolase domain-containing protein [Actinospica sp.]
MRIGLSGKVLIAVLFTAAASAEPLPARAATAGPGDGSATKSVTYLGHSFVVPSSWPVIDLAAGSTTCVRYDRHAVYLGTAPANQDCPARAMGRTETLVVQPASGAVAAAPFEDPTSHEIDTSAPGISVTATYGSSPAEVSGILAAAGLPVPAAGDMSGGPVQGLHSNVVSTGSASYSRFTGLGFDACSAPDSGTMNAWRSSSPYGAIGIYLGGVNMGCSQPNLTADWVSAQAAAGWRFFPIYVGPQAPGSSCGSCSVITSATAQGTSAAQDAASHAASLGFGAGTPIIYDMEAYAPSGTASVLAFMSAWTDELHALGYASAEYSSLDSGISDQINAGSGMPDVVDFAAWGSAPVTGDPSIPDTDWGNHQRIHQYSGGVTQSFGGYTLNLDQDFLDVQGSFTSPMGGELGDVTGDGRSDLVAIAQNGDLLVYPNLGGGGTNTFGSPTRAGGGWNGYTITAVTNPYGSGRAGLLAVAPDGTLLYYPNTGGSGTNTFGSPTQVGGGWTGYAIVAAADIHSSAGRPGLLAVAPDGALLYYPNTGGTGTGTFGPQTQVGNGWNGWTVDVADLTGDGRPDLLGVDSTGTLYLYPNTGRTTTGTFGPRTQVGGGWTGWRSIDVVPHPGTGTGAPAILGVDPDGTMYEYPSTAGGGTVAFGRPAQVGSGWIGYTIA